MKNYVFKGSGISKDFKQKEFELDFIWCNLDNEDLRKITTGEYVLVNFHKFIDLFL